MSLKAGRVGINSKYVDEFGDLKNLPGGSAAWGQITGTLSDQTDLKNALDAKQPTLEYDLTPTKNSQKMVNSGAIFDAIDDVYGVMGENGAKNKIINTKTTPTVSADVTYTPQADGSITVSGTPSARSSYDYLKIDNVKANVKYNVSGLSATTNLRFEGVSYYNNGSYSSVKTLETEENTSFTLDTVLTQDDTHYYVLIIKRTNNNVACTGTIYPMVWDARDTNPTYQPYAMTNAELTDAVNGITTKTEEIITGSGLTVELKKVGNVVVGGFVGGQASEDLGNNDTIINLPNGYKLYGTSSLPVVAYDTVSGNIKIINIDTNVIKANTPIATGVKLRCSFSYIAK